MPAPQTTDADISKARERLQRAFGVMQGTNLADHIALSVTHGRVSYFVAEALQLLGSPDAMAAIESEFESQRRARA